MNKNKLKSEGDKRGYSKGKKEGTERVVQTDQKEGTERVIPTDQKEGTKLARKQRFNSLFLYPKRRLWLSPFFEGTSWNHLSKTLVVVL